jgi:hypothetical protein
MSAGMIGMMRRESTTMPPNARRQTRRTRLLSFLAFVVAATAFAGAFATRADAQEIQLTGPLAGAPAVRHERLYRAGRFEIAPTVSFTLLDEYKRTIFVGGRLQYNVTDWFGFGVWGAYGAGQIDTNLTSEIDQLNPNGSPAIPRNIETAVNLNHTIISHGGTAPDTFGFAPFANQVGQWNWSITPQVQLTPFRGKLSIFEKIFVDTDAYIHGGVAFNGIQERENCGDGNGDPLCIDPSSFVLKSRVAVAPSFGLGLHFYFANFMSLGVEYRAIPFSWNRSGFNTATGANGLPTDTITSADHTFKFNQMISIEIGFALPAKPALSE